MGDRCDRQGGCRRLSAGRDRLTRTRAECRGRSGSSNCGCRGAGSLCWRRGRLLGSRTQASRCRHRSGRDRGSRSARRLCGRRGRLLGTWTQASRCGDRAGSDHGCRCAGAAGLLGQCGRIGRGLRRRWCLGRRRAGPLRSIRLSNRRNRSERRCGGGRRNLLSRRCSSRRRNPLSGGDCRGRRNLLSRRCSGRRRGPLSGRNRRGRRNALSGRCRRSRRRVLSRGNRCGRRCVLGGRCRCSRRMLLGRRRVRRARPALLAGRGLARTLARRAALLVLRIGRLGHPPSVIQGNRVAGAVRRRDDGQHCCGDEKRRSCHAVGPPDGSCTPVP